MLAEDLCEKVYKPKEALIEGLLYKRDLIAFGGKRRDGKTSLAVNIASALAAGQETFLGHTIHRPCRVQAIFLEDEPGEWKKKYEKVYAGLQLNHRLDLYLRDMVPRTTQASRIEDAAFRQFIADAAIAFKPDLLIIDNLTFLVNGNYNEATAMQRVHEFVYDVADAADCAVLVPAHIRKDDKRFARGKLREDREGWYEEIMGSSNFINTFGSLWGIERNRQKGVADFAGGTQRMDGEDTIVSVRFNKESGWFEVVEDALNFLELALNTEPRRRVWRELPKGQPVLHASLKALAKECGMGAGTWDHWWNSQLKNKLAFLVNPQENEWLIKDVKLFQG